MNEEGPTKAEREQIEEPKIDLRPCVACGRLSTKRWCSNNCFIAEDGYPEDPPDSPDDY